MIQFNLLPDIKVQYIKAQRTKRTVIFMSAIVTGAVVAILILLFLIVNVIQRQHLGNLQNDIETNKKILQGKPDLSKILTVQNQLNSLPALHEQKPVATRVFGYIQQVTPQQANISTLTVNFAEQTIRIEGSADTLGTVNIFTDTLKFTVFNAQKSDGSESTSSSAFSDVVLSDFAINSQAGDSKTARYSINLKYDPVIFDSASKVTLVVASQVTTRSETEKPTEIFRTIPQQATEGE